MLKKKLESDGIFDQGHKIELKKTYLTGTKKTNEFLKKLNTTELKDRLNLYNLLKRPEITMDMLETKIKKEYSKGVKEEVEIMIKYEGYIKKEEQEAKKMLEYENIKIPENTDFANIPNLATEARQKLIKVKPTSIGQAMRISGVNPADISIIMIYLKRHKND